MSTGVTKINTDYMYKITDALLQKGFIYKEVNTHKCKYEKDNITFIKEKIPKGYAHIYRFTYMQDNEVIKVYENKSEVKKLIQFIEETL